MPRQGNESDILSQSSADDFDYSHMSTEERSLFTKVMFRWFSKAANDQLALLVDGWTTWRRIDKYLKSKQQKSLYEKRCQEAAQVLQLPLVNCMPQLSLFVRSAEPGWQT